MNTNGSIAEGLSGGGEIDGDLLITQELKVIGDAVVEGDLEVKGNLVSDLRIDDPLWQTAINNTTTDNLNLGYFSHYGDSGEKYAGLVRSKDDKKFYLINNASTQPTAIDPVTNSQGNLKLNALEATSVTTGSVGNTYTLPTAKGTLGQILSVNASQNVIFQDPPVIISTTDDLAEGTTNLYYTEGRVTANVNVSGNTSKVSADGSVSTHSDVIVNAPTTGQILTYSGLDNAFINSTPVVPTSTLVDLTDTDIVAPNHGQIISYNNASGKWQNNTLPSIPSSINDLTDVDTAITANNDVLKYSTTSNEWQATNNLDLSSVSADEFKTNNYKNATAGTILTDSGTGTTTVIGTSGVKINAGSSDRFDAGIGYTIVSGPNDVFLKATGVNRVHGSAGFTTVLAPAPNSSSVIVGDTQVVVYENNVQRLVINDTKTDINRPNSNPAITITDTDISIGNVDFAPSGDITGINSLTSDNYKVSGVISELMEWDYRPEHAGIITADSAIKCRMAAVGYSRMICTKGKWIPYNIEVGGYIEAEMNSTQISGQSMMYGVCFQNPATIYQRLNAVSAFVTGNFYWGINSTNNEIIADGTLIYNNTFTAAPATAVYKVRVTRTSTILWTCTLYKNGTVFGNANQSITFGPENQSKQFSFLTGDRVFQDNSQFTCTIQNLSKLNYDSTTIYTITQDEGVLKINNVDDSNLISADPAGVKIDVPLVTGKGLCVHAGNFGYGACVESSMFFGYGGADIGALATEIDIMANHTSKFGDFLIPANFTQVGYIYDVNIKGLLKTGGNDDTLKFRVYMGNNTLVSESAGTFKMKKDLTTFRYWELHVQCICIGFNAATNKPRFSVSGIFKYNNKIDDVTDAMEGSGLIPLGNPYVEIVHDIAYPLKVTCQWGLPQIGQTMRILSSRITFSGFS